MANNSLVQNRSLIEYDNNSCKNITNFTYWDFQNVSCEFNQSGIIENHCGDGNCSSEESCSSCSADCGSCPTPKSSSSGGGERRYRSSSLKPQEKIVNKTITLNSTKKIISLKKIKDNQTKKNKETNQTILKELAPKKIPLEIVDKPAPGKVKEKTNELITGAAVGTSENSWMISFLVLFFSVVMILFVYQVVVRVKKK